MSGSRVSQPHGVPGLGDVPHKERSPKRTGCASGLPQSHRGPTLPDALGTMKRKETESNRKDKPRKSGEDESRRNSKRGREEEIGTRNKPSGRSHLFVDGVNRRDNAGSFWDLDDPELGWKIGKSILGDHDALHLLPQPIETLTHSLA